MQEAGLTVTTSRGAKVDAIADFPAGPGPFPAIVLAPGQGYHMARPALAQTARRLVAAGVAVYRFNWAKAGAPSNDLADELQDLEAVIATAIAEPRVNPEQVSVGGKSLGSVVAWRALAADKSLRSGLFLTPICSHVPKGQPEPACIAQENYPGIAAERRPLLFIAGDRDPWCAPALLHRFVANAGGNARVAIVGGDHSFEDKALTAAAADEFRTRNVGAVADIGAGFIAQAMKAESVIDRLTQELLAVHGVHTILLYGSHADGSAGPDSDYDIAAFGPVAQPLRIARLDAGGYFDVFIYPDALLLNPGDELLKLRGSKILVQREAQADEFLRRLEDLFRRGPVLLAADEIAARKVWARKMLARIGRADPEGNYRRAWLLQALLEDYFHIRGRWYEGPKKALRWLEQFEPPAYQAFCAALEPGASVASIAALVDVVVGSSAT